MNFPSGLPESVVSRIISDGAERSRQAGRDPPADLGCYEQKRGSSGRAAARGSGILAHSYSIDRGVKRLGRIHAIGECTWPNS
jgi:hypothetical protein